jgi:hypothetical protein
MSDILLVMDNKELFVRAVSEIDKDGKAKIVPADKKHQNDFLKVDYTFLIFMFNFFQIKMSEYCRHSHPQDHWCADIPLRVL